MPFTHEAHPDEPVFSVTEVELVPWDYGKRRRYRLVVVLRDDAKAVHYTDMGKVSDWPFPGFNLIAAWEHTVQEMVEDCEAQRADDFCERIVAEAYANSTLREDHQRQAAEEVEIIRNRSQFGPAGKTQRNEHRRSATRARTEAL